MILREATIKYSGNDPNILKSKSHKRICVSCDICGRVRWVEFYQYRNLCLSCKQKGKNNPNYKEKIILNCKQCNKEYEVIYSQKDSKFCSKNCYGRWMAINKRYENHPSWKGGNITKICIICGDEFEVIPANINQKCCSRKCGDKYRSKNIKGLNNPNYNPDLTDEDRIKNKSRTHSKEYKQWRLNVFKRDNFTCQICNNIGFLNAHHIESYNNNPDLRTILENGITLCKECHNDFHHIYGKGNNTEKQFIEFKDKMGDFKWL